MKIGFVGLGIMGHPMALNLIKGGHELFVFGKRRLPADVREAGATVCDTLKSIAERSEIVILMVPDTPDVKSVLFDPEGVAEGLSPGKTVVDMSSISPIETKEFAAAIKAEGLRLCRRAGVRRRGRRAHGFADDHGRRDSKPRSPGSSRFSS